MNDIKYKDWTLIEEALQHLQEGLYSYEEMRAMKYNKAKANKYAKENETKRQLIQTILDKI